MNAQLAVALQDAGNAIAMLARLAIAGERMGGMAEFGQAAALFEQAAHRVRGVANGMRPPEPVVQSEAAE